MNKTLKQGTLAFLFFDKERDPRHPETLRVTFEKLPVYMDPPEAVENEFRRNCTFTVEEV